MNTIALDSIRPEAPHAFRKLLSFLGAKLRGAIELYAVQFEVQAAAYR